jgi:hypothetical protein
MKENIVKQFKYISFIHIKMIYHLLNTCLVVSLFVEMLERRFPQQVRDVLTNVTFSAIYLYSKIQIKLAKWQINIIKLVESNPTLSKIKNELNAIMKQHKGSVNIIEFIKNGERLTNCETSVCDFALVSWLGHNKCVNKKIMYDINEPLTVSECSDIKFMLVEMRIRENNVYKVDLKTDNYNFYLVGNKLTRQFFIYYLKQHLKIDDTINDSDKMQLKIIDQDVNTIQIDFTDKNESILLEKSVYKVVM